MAVVIKINNITLLYSTTDYAVDRRNANIYAICPADWHLLPAQASVKPFMSLPTLTT